MSQNGSSTVSPNGSSDAYGELKVAIHERLLNSMDLARANGLEESVLRAECESKVRSILDGVKPSVPVDVHSGIVTEVLDDIFGYGPLPSLMAAATVSDILVNGANEVFVEREGTISRTSVVFRDDAHVMNVINRIVRFSGRRLDESSPMVDARLPDGSRVNAVIPPLSLDGPVLCIRRFGKQDFSMQTLVRLGMLAPEMVDFLETCVRYRMNVIISGGSGAGKTTLLNALSAAIPSVERVVTIEDAAELRLDQQHVVRLETRPPNVEGSGEITTRDAVRNALRMRPDRILVGECRGAEAFDMLQAMNSGHGGSMTTMHANGTKDAFRRLEGMLCMAGMEVPVPVLREYVGSAIDLVVQVERMESGIRRIVGVAEVMPLEGGSARIEEIYRYRMVPGENANGYYESTGHVPLLLERLALYGVNFDPTRFAPKRLDADYVVGSSGRGS
jgi:pilus assembly protein CpaF